MKHACLCAVAGFALLGMLGFSSAAQAGKANDTLVYASDLEVENIAAYYNNLREGVIVKRHVWDTLVYRDLTSGEFLPMLATSWKWVDDKTVDFTLREGVKFHNGDPFTADDVVFTVNFTLSPQSKIARRADVNWMESAEKLDERTVRIHLKAVFPAAMAYFSGPVPILPAKYFQAQGIDGFARKPVGTGPYKIVEITNGLTVKMEKNENYWEGSPIGKPSIGKLEFRPIKDGETRLAELLSGGVDWIWRVPYDQSQQLAKMPGLTVTSSETIRTGTLQFDVLGRSEASVPLKDKRVRQAISYAIDRKGLVENIVRGKSAVLNAFCYPQQFGCYQGVPTYDYNVAKAKALLAEAGYPNGFDTEIWAYSEREYVEAMIGYLRAVGIRAKLNFLQYPPLRDAAWKGKVPILFLSVGSNSIFDVTAITSIYFKGAEDDMARDPEVIALLEAGDNSAGAEVRKEKYAKALSRISSEALALPLFSYSMEYAFKQELDFKATPDELPQFFAAKWK